MITRDKTKVVYVGNVPVGGNHPVVIESMTNTNTSDIPATIGQIKALEKAGCEIVRLAVPDEAGALAIGQIKQEVSIPIIADIHFNYRLALLAVENGADKLRINPGNIGDATRVRAVAQAAQARGIPIRVGVNAGSLEKGILAKYGGINPQGLAESALTNVALLEDAGFDNIVVSVKASNAPLLIEANKILAQTLSHPLHIGLTEAGTAYSGAIRSAVGVGVLLNMGLGSTIRISLAGDPVQEIYAAKEILATLGLRQFGPVVIACPTCGRTQANIASIAERLEKRLLQMQKPIRVAVMGCEVNGPGEAADADVGIAFGREKAVLFKKGEIVRVVNVTSPLGLEHDVEDVLFQEIYDLR